MDIRGIAHVCLLTPDLERLVQFYEQNLSCRVIHDFRNSSNERYGVFLFVGGRSFLEIFLKKELVPSTFAHVCFEVPDATKVHKLLISRGIDATLFKGKTDQVLQCWLTDPDGNRIEFHEYNEESVQARFLKSRGAPAPDSD